MRKAGSLSERLFDGTNAENEIGDILYESGLQDFEELGWDDYDCSLEIYGVAPEYRMPEELQRKMHEAGFAIVYVNHTDFWETHYHFNPTGEFELSKGWRVSYPHKRNDGTKNILLEEPVVSWPMDWFKTGYAKIVEWISPKK